MGIFKKLMIADRLAIIVNNVYENVDGYTGISLLIVMFLQAIYIYSDFSGYTDIAIGMAALFGIKLTNNFNRPFFATNVSDFWRRWHISLTTWCNNYIFRKIILKRMKWKQWASVYGVVLTFFIIGIWHGPMWTFVILGLLQAIAINYEFITKRRRLKIGAKLPKSLNKLLSRLFTFFFFSFSLIFFFGQSIGDSFYFASHLFDFSNSWLTNSDFGLNHYDLIVALASILFLFIYEAIEHRGYSFLDSLNKKTVYFKWTVYYIIIFIILVHGYFATTNFVYIQF